MTCLDTARQYLEAWNAHDADAIVETFAGDGTYRLTGEKIFITFFYTLTFTYPITNKLPQRVFIPNY